MDSPQVLAAGGILTEFRRGKLRYLLVHRPRYNDWSLPKGKVDDDDENLAGTALREVEEETGVTARLGPHVGTADYDDRSGRHKRVQWWAMVPVEQRPHRPDDEVDRIKWVKGSKLDKKLTYGTDRRIMDGFHEDRRSLLIVRHAHAGARGDHDPDHKRPLSSKGRKQAEGLVDQLGDHHFDTIVTSPFTRCRDTVADVAAARGLRVVTDKRLAEGADIADVLGLIEELPDTAVLCTHRDVIETLCEYWQDDQDLAPGMEFAHERRKKGSTWWVTTTGTTARAARWIPPA